MSLLCQFYAQGPLGLRNPTASLTLKALTQILKWEAIIIQEMVTMARGRIAQVARYPTWCD